MLEVLRMLTLSVCWLREVLAYTKLVQTEKSQLWYMLVVLDDDFVWPFLVSANG